MTGEELLEKMDLIQPEYLEEAEALPHKKKVWILWAGLAAAAVLSLLIWNSDKGSPVTIAGIERNYKESWVFISEATAVSWPWNYLAETEKYTVLEYNGTEYRTSGRTVDPAFLGKPLGTCVLPSISDTGEVFSLEKSAYSIAGVSPEKIVAAELNGEYYVYKLSPYSPPTNLGEFLDDFGMPHTIELERFTHFVNQKVKGHYSLEASALIWDILNTCRKAEYVDEDFFHANEDEYISFTVTSQQLGSYKQVIYITSDGYLKTNIMGYRYVFRIGEAAAQQIISYAMKNSAAAPVEPYYHSVSGTFIGMKDGYLLVDDTVLCVREQDGMVFRIPAADIRISRAVELGYVSEGDIVAIYFTGPIDSDSGNIVEGPISIHKGILSGGNVLIPE